MTQLSENYVVGWVTQTSFKMDETLRNFSAWANIFLPQIRHLAFCHWARVLEGKLVLGLFLPPLVLCNKAHEKKCFLLQLAYPCRFHSSWRFRPYDLFKTEKNRWSQNR